MLLCNNSPSEQSAATTGVWFSSSAKSLAISTSTLLLFYIARQGFQRLLKHTVCISCSFEGEIFLNEGSRNVFNLPFKRCQFISDLNGKTPFCQAETYQQTGSLELSMEKFFSSGQKCVRMWVLRLSLDTLYDAERQLCVWFHTYLASR